jgi:hypothetical protein
MRDKLVTRGPPEHQYKFLHYFNKFYPNSFNITSLESQRIITKFQWPQHSFKLKFDKANCNNVLNGFCTLQGNLGTQDIKMLTKNELDAYEKIGMDGDRNIDRQHTLSVLQGYFCDVEFCRSLYNYLRRHLNWNEVGLQTPPCFEKVDSYSLTDQNKLLEALSIMLAKFAIQNSAHTASQQAGAGVPHGSALFVESRI